jgi:uncharacterized protein YjlB
LSTIDGLVVVGAYPPEGKYEEFKESKSDHDRAVKMIAKVPLPLLDPVYGDGGALKRLWRKDHSLNKRTKPKHSRR